MFVPRKKRYHLTMPLLTSTSRSILFRQILIWIRQCLKCQKKIELITETKNAFSAVIAQNGTAKEYPILVSKSNHRIQLEEVESYDVNLDGFYDLIITLNHLQGHSLGDATYQENVILKFVLDTFNAVLLLRDTVSIEQVSTLLLGEDSDPTATTIFYDRPIHVFEGKIVFMPCTGNRCEITSREAEYIWNGTAFSLKEN